MKIVWLTRDEVVSYQAASINKHGGSHGVLNSGALDAALNKPLNLNYYEGVTDVCLLAASYAYGLVKNHCFVDGNKRIGFLASYVFLRANGRRLTAPQEEVINKFLWLAVVLALGAVLGLILWLHSKGCRAEVQDEAYRII